MGGLNAADKLNQQGISTRKDTAIKVDVDDVFIPREGPIAHPRADDPVEEDLLADILERGEIVEPIYVRRDGVYGGKMRLTVVDGSRRTNGLRAAIRVWKERGEMRPERRFIRIRFFEGSDKDALRFRLEENSRPLQKPDRPSVLATTARQLQREQATIEEILLSMPRSQIRTLRDVHHLLRWPSLVAEAADRFDSGAWPLGLLGQVLDAPREEQVSTGDRLAASGTISPSGPSRARRREAGGTETSPARQARIPPKKLDRVVARLDEHHARNEDAVAWGFALGVRFARAAVDAGALPEALREVVEKALAEDGRRRNGDRAAAGSASIEPTVPLGCEGEAAVPDDRARGGGEPEGAR